MPPKGDGGKRREEKRGHSHNYVTQRSNTYYETEEDTGRRVKITYNHQKCQNPGCPDPNNIDIQREYP